MHFLAAAALAERKDLPGDIFKIGPTFKPNFEISSILIAKTTIIRSRIRLYIETLYVDVWQSDPCRSETVVQANGATYGGRKLCVNLSIPEDTKWATRKAYARRLKRRDYRLIQ
jgi:hypothetical protein